MKGGVLTDLHFIPGAGEEMEFFHVFGGEDDASGVFVGLGGAADE